ncbi:MAG TPA: hypothetical protein VFZ52_04635, partial [Chryseolinea sp.]
MKVLLTIALLLFIWVENLAQCNSFFPLKENVRYEYELFDKKEKLTSKVAQTLKTVSGSGDNMDVVVTYDLYDAKKGDKTG